MVDYAHFQSCALSWYQIKKPYTCIDWRHLCFYTILSQTQVSKPLGSFCAVCFVFALKCTTDLLHPNKTKNNYEIKGYKENQIKLSQKGLRHEYIYHVHDWLRLRVLGGKKNMELQNKEFSLQAGVCRNRRHSSRT